MNIYYNNNSDESYEVEGGLSGVYYSKKIEVDCIHVKRKLNYH